MSGPSVTSSSLRSAFADLAADSQRSAPTTPEDAILTLAVDQIHPRADQVRRAIPPNELQDLATSIQENTLLQPIVVTPAMPPDTGYELIAGERRWRAVQLLGQTTIRAILLAKTNITPLGRSIANITENLQRQDIHFLDLARACRAILDTNPALSSKDLAQRLGKSPAWLTHLLATLTCKKPLTEEAIETQLLMDPLAVPLFDRLPAELQTKLLHTAKTSLKPMSRPQLQKAHEALRKQPSKNSAPQSPSLPAPTPDPLFTLPPLTKPHVERLFHLLDLPVPVDATRFIPTLLEHLAFEPPTPELSTASS